MKEEINIIRREIKNKSNLLDEYVKIYNHTQPNKLKKVLKKK